MNIYFPEFSETTKMETEMFRLQLLRQWFTVQVGLFASKLNTQSSLFVAHAKFDFTKFGNSYSDV